MSSVPKKTVSPPYDLLGSDAEMLEAVLSVHRRLGIEEQLKAILDRVGSWTGAVEAIALGPAEDPRLLAVSSSTLTGEDPRLEVLSGIDGESIRRSLSGSKADAALTRGLGPMAELVQPWPEDEPLFSAVLPVPGPSSRWAGLIWLFFDGPVSDDLLERCERLIEWTQPAVHNALQVLSMRELIIKDDTAHCFNRRYFESCLPEELSRASRFHAPLSLIFLDMDNLKEVNKRYGHAMGSRTLFEVSKRVRRKIRKFDKLFRFGGDEFCIVLPETEWHGALEVAERVRDAIAGKPFLTGQVDTDGVRMTASLGIASYPLHARTTREMIEYADRAMQRIKSGTKNSIGIAEIVGEDHDG